MPPQQAKRQVGDHGHRATSLKVITATQRVAAGYRTGYPRITSQTPYPLGHLSPFYSETDKDIDRYKGELSNSITQNTIAMTDLLLQKNDFRIK